MIVRVCACVHALGHAFLQPVLIYFLHKGNFLHTVSCVIPFKFSTSSPFQID